MFGSTNELIHAEIKGIIESRPIWISFDYILAYDIDFDETKIRFWKDHEGVRISRRWRIPPVKNEMELVNWVNQIVAIFAVQTVTEDELFEREGGYTKGGKR